MTGEVERTAKKAYKNITRIPKKTLKEVKRIIPSPPKPIRPTEPDPSPTPIMSDEIQSAKSRVREKKKKGRRATILAGRMMAMAGRRNILNTQLNTKLGES
jgi:hypothetical protein